MNITTNKYVINIYFKYMHKSKGTNQINENLLKMITDEGSIYMVPGKVNDLYFLRFAICAASTEEHHVDFAWNIIKRFTDIILPDN